MNTKLHILGAGGHAKVVIDVAMQLGYNELYLYDDAIDLIGKEVCGITVVGNSQRFFELNNNENVFIAVGSNTIRQRLAERIFIEQLNIVTLAAPSASVSNSCVLGKGVLIAPNATVNADAHIEDGVIVNSASVVEHDVSVGSFSHIAPNSVLLGGANVGCNCLVGASSVVLPLVSLGDGVVLGANATATKNLATGVYIGSPARLIQ